MLKVSLSHIQGLQPELDWLGTCEHPRVSISDRSLTIRGTHFIYETGHQAKVALKNRDWRVMVSESVLLTNW